MRGLREPMGTFGYLLSVEGARRLLQEGTIFPLHYQLDVRRGDDMVANPHRTQISQFEFFEFFLSLIETIGKQFYIEQFEPRVSQSTVSFPPSQDVQLNCAYADGLVSAHRCGDECCLFHSAPCQFVDSDVQACWSADHTPQLRGCKEAFHRRVQELDDDSAADPPPALALPPLDPGPGVAATVEA